MDIQLSNIIEKVESDIINDTIHEETINGFIKVIHGILKGESVDPLFF